MEKKQNRFSITNLIATCNLIGYIPFAPGTFASIIAMLTLYLMPQLSIITHFVILNVLFFVATFVSEKTIIETGEKDSPTIVIDEWFGMWLALFLVPKNFWFYVLALVIFRIFDITKLWPINLVEKHTPGGLGVVLDDTVAGFFTFVIMQLVCLIL